MRINIITINQKVGHKYIQSLGQQHHVFSTPLIYCKYHPTKLIRQIQWMVVASLD
jgi:hypothetical protein